MPDSQSKLDDWPPLTLDQLTQLINRICHARRRVTTFGGDEDAVQGAAGMCGRLVAALLAFHREHVQTTTQRKKTSTRCQNAVPRRHRPALTLPSGASSQ